MIFSENRFPLFGIMRCLVFGVDFPRRQENVMAATSKPAPAGAADNLFSASLREVDPEIAEAIQLELGRQQVIDRKSVV